MGFAEFFQIQNYRKDQGDLLANLIFFLKCHTVQEKPKGDKMLFSLISENNKNTTGGPL